MTPFFSIILPTYNRAPLIRRAIDSCLSQSFGDFEVIVIDDGSTDRSSEVVTGCSDPRVRLVRHDRNRGVSPARNSGMAVAGGRWFVFLDSDDELLPDALGTIHAVANQSADDVVGLRFMCTDEYGNTSPNPPLQDSLWDYRTYLVWLESMRGFASETLPCTRASTYPLIAYPEDRALEGLYHLDIARAGKVRACTDIVRWYRQDAHDRLTVPDARRSLAHAADAAREVTTVLNRHGAAIEHHAPGIYQDLLRGGALFSFLAGARGEGLAYASRFLKQRPQSARMYAILLAGILDRRLLAWLQQVKGRAPMRHVRKGSAQISEDVNAA